MFIKICSEIGSVGNSHPWYGGILWKIYQRFEITSTQKNSQHWISAQKMNQPNKWSENSNLELYVTRSEEKECIFFGFSHNNLDRVMLKLKLLVLNIPKWVASDQKFGQFRAFAILNTSEINAIKNVKLFPMVIFND